MASTSVNLKRIKRNKGYVYQIDYRVNGKRVREVVGNDKRTAELKRASVQQELLLGKLRLPAITHRSVSIQALLDEYLKSKSGRIRGASLKRYSSFSSHLRAFFEHNFPVQAADIRLIELKHLNEFMDDIQKGEKGWARKTVNGAIQFCRSAFRFAVDSNYLEETPMLRMKEFRIPSAGAPNIFTEEQLNKIYAVVDPYWRPCLEFIANTGLRKGEMINLTWDAVTLDTNQTSSIVVESTDEWETKTGKTRTIPLNPRAFEIISSMKGQHPDYVFVSKSKKKIHPDKPYHALKSALKKLDLEGDVHKLRHTMASKLAMENVSPFVIKELLGHSDLKTTEIYTHAPAEYLRSAVNKLEATRETEEEL